MHSSKQLSQHLRNHVLMQVAVSLADLYLAHSTEHVIDADSASCVFGTCNEHI